MKKDIRKCLYCGKDIDISIEPFKKVNRRYLHEQCAIENEKVENSLKVSREVSINEYREVLDWVRNHIPSPNYALVQKQLKEYIKAGMKYQSIYKTLIWYYDVCGNDINKAQGIGIVPLQFENAKAYYRHVWELEQQAKGRPLQSPTIEVHITAPERNPYHKKIFTFLDEKEEK